MTPSVKAAAIAAVLVALPARAQVQNAFDRDAGLPAGIAVPVAGVAAAEEPAAITTTPAAAALVSRLALQWFHEGDVTKGSDADGIWAANSFGPLGVGFAMQWIRPGAEDVLRRYRKTTLALALGDGHVFSAGFGWNWWSSPDPGLERLASWDVGITVRPMRHLSIAASMRDRDGRLDGVPLPVRYDLGLATRFWDDRLTLAADLLADDRSRDDFFITHYAFGAGAEVTAGFALTAQVQVPVRRTLAGPDRTLAVIALAWNGPHSGWTGGVTPVRDRTGWLIGARTSTERYLAPELPGTAPAIDVGEALEPPRTFAFLTFGEPDPYGRLLARLEALRNDPQVGAVVLRIDDLSLGAGRVVEVRAALARLRERKPVLAYLVGGGTREYWLATGATTIAAQPGQPLFVNGLSTSTLYFRDALARLGIAVEVAKRGAYKSAPEPLVRTDPSPEAREATNALLDDLYGRFVADVAEARRLSAPEVRKIVDTGLLTSEEARDAKLLDEVLWPDEVETWVRRVSGERLALARGYRPAPERRAQRWGPRDRIEVIRVEGTIASGKSRGEGILGGIAGAETIAAQIRHAAGERAVRAIVLRVESPGGDGSASDVIWREVVRARRRKPVIASMGDLAASGGYLAAVGADVVVASPTTLTGSIGVFALKPDLSGLLAKLSIARTSYARGENAQLTSLAKPWTPSERAVVERQIERFYGLFLDRVAEGRKLPRADVEKVAGGRVWTGRQALEHRLVDRLGSLGDAIEIAKERAGLGPDALVIVLRAEGARATVGGILSAAVAAAAPPSALERAVAAIPELRALSVLSELGPIVAMPVDWVVPEAP